MLPTLLAAAGDPDLKEKLLKGMRAGVRTFEVHLVGYNLTPTPWPPSRPARARSSSTSPTTARWWACGPGNGRSVRGSRARLDRLAVDIHAFILVPAQQCVGQFLTTFREFPPSQHVGSYSLDQALEMLTKGAGDR